MLQGPPLGEHALPSKVHSRSSRHLGWYGHAFGAIVRWRCAFVASRADLASEVPA
jgi:hypothetical protein